MEKSSLGFGSNFKKCLLGAAVTALAWTGCDIPHDNPLDPMNPASARPAKIMIEAFVNLRTGFPYDEYMVDALDSLAALYPDLVVIAEYHKNVQNFLTPYHRDENEVLYRHYLDAIGSNLKGLPDVFINGTESRIQGAADKASAFFRLQQCVIARASAVGHFSIEIAAAVAGNQVTPQVTLARLGNSDAENLRVKAVLVSRIASPRYTRVVTGAVSGTEIGRLTRGQILKISLPSMQADDSVPRELIAYVCDRDEKNIYQVEKIRIGE